MLTTEECEWMHEHLKDTMVGALGIHFTPTDDESVRAEMPINSSTRQYFGILHGGASLTLAETVAGAGSLRMAGFDKKVCGLQVTGNHVGMSPTEGKVIGVATPIHIGRSTHVWNVDVRDESGKLISTERVTNMILS